MSHEPSDTLRSFRRKPGRTSIEVDAGKNAAGGDLGLRDEEQAFEFLRSFSNNCPLPFMFVPL